MTVWVVRDGELVVKGENRDLIRPVNSLPLPMISRLEPYRSPVNGREITSWRQRDRDLRDSNSYDPRDNTKGFVPSKGREVQLRDRKDVGSEPEQLDFWK